MRTLNISLSILIYEDLLPIEELKHFNRQELEDIKIHCTRECIKKEATRLLKSS